LHDRAARGNCYQGGAPLADATLAGMRSGKQLRVVFQNANKQAMTVTMPLPGFSMVYDKVES
jgi:invasion protein IalB